MFLDFSFKSLDFLKKQSSGYTVLKKKLQNIIAKLEAGGNNQQPSLEGQPGRNGQQQPNLQRHVGAEEQIQNNQRGAHRRTIFRLPTEVIPEAELDEIKCALCQRSAREYKRNRQPVARTECGHFFCVPCIFRWKKTSPSCPICFQQVLQPRRSEGLFLFQVI
ncbi:hypothetical protein JTE90_016921 [Oedothorax gibbosus]|uniref:RING-type domain-containing protein n=1 Tax=Oedothorax gibbosus TaxID=931172 RepID=A0AAV6USZ1_9ARAC|nr:hypothetical protein JTE90_016921 [Oedothorax gibbosus]